MRLRSGGVAVATGVEMNPLDVSQFDEEIERAVHGRQAYVRIHGARLAIDLCRRQMVIRLRDDVQHRLTRAR